MNKVFKHICAFLACESLTASEDKFTLTTAQLDTIENSIEAKEKSISEFKAEIASLKEANAKLEEKIKTLPAASTNHVVDDKPDPKPEAEKSDIERFFDTTNSAQALFDSLP